MKKSLAYFFAKEKALKEKGEKVLGFTLISPEFPPPASLEENMTRLYPRSFSYSTSGGDFALRDTLASFYSKKWSQPLKRENVFVGNGGKESLFILLQILLKKGGEAIVISPYWSSYPRMVASTPGKLKIFKTSEKNGFYPDVKKLAKEITSKTKVLILNTPCNPTGKILKEEDVKFLAELSKKKNFFIISDEVYEIYDYEGYYSSFLKFFNKNIFCVFSASKSFSLCGWRLGWGFGEKKLIEEMADYQSNLSTSPHTLSQLVIKEFFEKPEALSLHFDTNKKEAKARRDMAASFLAGKNISYILPEGGIAICVKIPPSFKDTYAFAEALLSEEKVSVAPGEIFGQKNYFRMNLSLPVEDIKEGLNRIAKFYSNK